jgi:hypothetical protein
MSHGHASPHRRAGAVRVLVRAGKVVAGALGVACSDGPSGIDRPPDGVDRLEVIPATAWLSPGATLSLTGTALSAEGTPVTGVSLDWSSAAVSVATVSATGSVQAVANGQTTITSRAGSLRATSRVTVVPPVRSASFAMERQGVSDVSLLGAWADATTSEAFAVGQFGGVLHHVDGAWRLENLGTEKAATGAQHEMMIALESGRLLDCDQVRIAGVNCKEFVTGGKLDQCHAILGHSDPQ